jgi:O-6-methylguanine DNA methyltransferase
MKKVIAKVSFREKVLDVVRVIKEGKVMTYKSVAEKAGNKNASRAVGNFMKANYDKTVPCHRVVRSDGVVGDYNRGGKTKKISILKKEGVKFSGEKVILK